MYNVYQLIDISGIAIIHNTLIMRDINYTCDR